MTITYKFKGTPAELQQTLNKLNELYTATSDYRSEKIEATVTVEADDDGIESMIQDAMHAELGFDFDYCLRDMKLSM